MEKQREPGCYWVRLNGEWLIGEYKTSWNFCDPMLDSPGGRDDEDLEEIDERRIERPKEIVVSAPVYISNNPYLCKPDDDAD